MEEYLDQSEGSNSPSFAGFVVSGIASSSSDLVITMFEDGEQEMRDVMKQW